MGAALGRTLVEEARREGALPPIPTLPKDSTVMALVGELGSGKTVFTKGLASGIGVKDSKRVTSPTFVLRQDYQGHLCLHHYDVIRLTGAAELLGLGFSEDLGTGALVVVEWADRVIEAIPPDALLIEFEHLGPLEIVTGIPPVDSRRRKITFRGNPTPWEDRMERAIGFTE